MPQLEEKPWLIVIFGGLLALAGGGGGAAVTALSDARDMGRVLADIRHLQENHSQLRSDLTRLADDVAELARVCASEETLLNQDKALRQLILTQRIGHDKTDARQWEQLSQSLIDVQQLQSRVENVERRLGKVDVFYDWIKTKGTQP